MRITLQDSVELLTNEALNVITISVTELHDAVVPQLIDTFEEEQQKKVGPKLSTLGPRLAYTTPSCV